MKRETLVTFSDCMFEGDLGEVISKLSDIKKTWKKAGYIDIQIEIADEWGYYDEHNTVVKITGKKELINGRDLFK